MHKKNLLIYLQEYSGESPCLLSRNSVNHLRSFSWRAYLTTPSLISMRLELSLSVFLYTTCWAANPDAPRPGVLGAQKLATAADCSGPVGFSSIGTLRVHTTGLISYRNTLVDRGVGFSRETGEFTVHCPGIYHIAFAAYGKTPNTRVILKKRGSNKGASWDDVASAGGEKSGGGSNQVLLELEVGDQTAVWLASGDISPQHDSAQPSTTFTAFRIAKKN